MGQPIEGSNPSLSATHSRRSFRARVMRWAHEASVGLTPKLRIGAFNRQTMHQPHQFAVEYTFGAAGDLKPSVRRTGHALGARRAAYHSPRRARRGTSGALYLQSASAGLNSHPRPAFAKAGGKIGVEDRVPRSGDV